MNSAREKSCKKRANSQLTEQSLMAKNTFSAAKNAPNNTDRKRESDPAVQKSALSSGFCSAHGRSRLHDLYKNCRKKRIGCPRMTCWKWFEKMLNEAGIRVTDKNKDKIDRIIHRYVGEQQRCGRCSAEWRKALEEIEEDEALKKELMEQLQTPM